MTVAEAVAPLVRAAVGREAPVEIRGWDGSRTGPPNAQWAVKINNRRGLRRLLWTPNELGFARAYVSGDIEIEGNLLDGLEVLEQMSDPARGPGVRIDAETKKAVVKAALRLGIIGPPPKPPAEEARLARGHRHDKRRDASAISHHYDVGNDFYRLVLGESMTYSCGYWATPDEGLAVAQYAKCDLVARKLGLTAGMRVLDVGCGWGTFALHAARTYGVQVVGVTLSREQADYASKRTIEEGTRELVEIRVQDYRDIDDGPFDAISSIGMAEHVGAAMLPTYAGHLYGLLRGQGRLLNHAISRRPGKPAAFSKTSFIDRYVFPDGEIQPMATVIDALERAGFEVCDVESLREHYSLTLRAWVTNLEDNWEEAVTFSSAGRARIWRLYMAGSALGFTANRLGINQILAVKCDEHGRSGIPSTRTDSLRSRASNLEQPAADNALVAPPQYRPIRQRRSGTGSWAVRRLVSDRAAIDSSDASVCPLATQRTPLVVASSRVVHDGLSMLAGQQCEACGLGRLPDARIWLQVHERWAYETAHTGAASRETHLPMHALAPNMRRHSMSAG